jgi:hypothetical protein
LAAGGTPALIESVKDGVNLFTTVNPERRTSRNMSQRIAARAGHLRRSATCDRPGFTTWLERGDRGVIMRRDDTHACARRMESVQGAEAFVSVFVGQRARAACLLSDAVDLQAVPGGVR